MSGFANYNGQYLAHDITLEGVEDNGFAKLPSAFRVNTNPRQIKSARFSIEWMPMSPKFRD